MGREPPQGKIFDRWLRRITASGILIKPQKIWISLHLGSGGVARNAAAVV